MWIIGVTAMAAGLALGGVEARAQALPPPISPASEGKLQCYEPNRAAKTCRSIARYERNAAGEIVNPSVVLLTPKPAIAMTATTKVTVKDGQVCGVVAVADIEAAQFTVDGAPATPDQIARLRQAVESAEQGVLGKLVCTAYVPDGDGFIGTANFDGAPQPQQLHVIWVSPADGYSVGP